MLLVEQGVEDNGESVHVVDGVVDEGEEEVFVVVEPNAVAKPRAMVVHSHYAAIALSAVVCSHGLHTLALAAVALTRCLRRSECLRHYHLVQLEVYSLLSV